MDNMLEEMGYSKNDRLVILHADDLGMCQATLTAFEKLWECGGVSSGAVMPPCPWFPGLTAFMRDHPDVDMGIHATLNCEWDSYRWGAVSTCDLQSGLLDEDGYLHKDPAKTLEKASPEVVSAELTAQIDRARKAGIEFSHIDSHMGALFFPTYIEDYVKQAIDNKVPAMLPRVNAVGIEGLGFTEEKMEIFEPVLDELERQGFPLIDGIVMMPLNQPEGQMEIAKELLSQVPVGVTHFILHPAEDTPELRAICPDWPSRVANYQTFMDEEIRAFLISERIHVIGYKELRGVMRAA